MSNTNRRITDSYGNQFMPMNVDGGSGDEHFINTTKLVFIGIVFFSLLFIIMYSADRRLSIAGILILLAVWLFISQLIIRFIVFEEKTYYKMYKVMQKYQICTPAIFWDIASIRDTYDGAIMTFTDAKIGVMVKLERDTITGKAPDFKETHYDAISDFYRELMQRKYSFVQRNCMEPAGDDPRLSELDKLVHRSVNPNIRELMEKEIGFIKSISRNTLFESDYILIYTSDVSKVDDIISDVTECLFRILEGGYIGYSILSSKDIINVVKEIYGVKYFNYTQATIDMLKMSGAGQSSPFNIVRVDYTDGDYQVVDKKLLNKINIIASDIFKGNISQNDLSIKDALRVVDGNKFIEVDLEKISKGYGSGNAGYSQNISNRHSVRRGKPDKVKNKHKEKSFNIDNNEKSFNNQELSDFDFYSDDDEKIDF